MWQNTAVFFVFFTTLSFKLRPSKHNRFSRLCYGSHQQAFVCCNFYSHAVGLMVQMSDQMGLRCDSRVLIWFARSARLKAQHCVELFSWCYTTHEREQVRIPTVQDLKKNNDWWITDDSWESRDDAGVCTLQVFQSISWVKLQVCVRQTFWKKKKKHTIFLFGKKKSQLNVLLFLLIC